ncbi:MAG: hypothetical protein AAF515_03385 [Pseudomonadota bacterium]
MRRREFLDRTRVLAVAATAGLVARPSYAHHADFTSPLIYLSPVSQTGRLSSCQAEVWFQAMQDGLYVVTQGDAWRATAIDRGWQSARIWVGDVGPWRRSSGRYKELPALTLRARRVRDPAAFAPVLARMGRKYSAEWSTWGPRFRDGLASGERVMLHYPTPA